MITNWEEGTSAGSSSLLLRLIEESWLFLCLMLLDMLKLLLLALLLFLPPESWKLLSAPLSNEVRVFIRLELRFKPDETGL